MPPLKTTMPKRGGKRKKTRTHLDNAPAGAHVLGEGSLKEDVPKSIVAKASKVRNISTNTLNERAFQPTYSSKALPQVYPNVVELVLDVRKLMNPNTANSLRERRFASYSLITSFTLLQLQQDEGLHCSCWPTWRQSPPCLFSN